MSGSEAQGAQIAETSDRSLSKPRQVNVRDQRQFSIRTWIFVIRITSLATTWTFFQPDEYFQSLEPAWQLVFGQDNGAWITWEWDHQLRSSLHPILIAVVYCIISAINCIFAPPLSLQSRLLILAPRLLHTFATGVQDYYTWKLADTLLGHGSNEVLAALSVSLLSPWQYFAGTRSLTNGLEASLTVAALASWPWQWYEEKEATKSRKLSAKGISRSVVLAALAVILRPTNGLIWFTLTGSLVFYASQEELLYLIQQLSIYGTAIVAASCGLDRLFYGTWTFPPAKFFGFNVVENIAEFYGSNRRDYYFTEGLPLLLMTFLPFALIGFYQARQGTTNQEPEPSNGDNRAAAQKATQSPATKISGPNSTNALRALATTALVMLTALSCIVHKEVRFLYPLFPIFAVLAARSMTQFFTFSPFSIPTSGPKQLLALTIVGINIAVSYYISTIHQRGPLDVPSYLRGQFYAINADTLASSTPIIAPTWFFTTITAFLSQSQGSRYVRDRETLKAMSVAFLAPCHSTPWRSHLVHPEIYAWALTCEPPISLNATAREEYLDEADRFYLDPAAWLRENMQYPPITANSWIDRGWDMRDAPLSAKKAPTENAFEGMGRRPWPRYLVLFEQLEGVMRDVLGGEGGVYEECWRGFNSHWHDDWRRRGDIVVWCVGGSVGEGQKVGGSGSVGVSTAEEL